MSLLLCLHLMVYDEGYFTSINVHDILAFSFACNWYVSVVVGFIEKNAAQTNHGPIANRNDFICMSLKNGRVVLNRLFSKYIT